MAKKQKKYERVDACGPGGCAIRRPAGGRIAVSFPGFSYSSGSMRGGRGATPPCSTARKTCPVQLVFDRGQPKLRFCSKQGEPGRLVSVASAEEARRVSIEACACWRKNRKSFKRCAVTSGPLGRLFA
jgi:hypothetical protein